MNNASLGPTAMGQHLVYKVYDNEQHAARAAQLLVEAGFPAQQVYIGVERDRRLARASTGRGQRLGLAMLVGAAISAALGAMIVSAATIDFVDTPLALLAGMSPMTIAVLALAPLAIPGALLGWLFETLRWRARDPGFPADAPRAPTFVGVEVSPGNHSDALLTLHESREAMLERADDWRRLAQEALHTPRAA